MNTIENEDAPIYNLDKSLNSEADIIDLALEHLQARLRVYGHSFSSSCETIKYLTLKTAELEREEFGVLFLNNQNKLIVDEVMSTGTIDSASVYPREVVKRALEVNAAAVILYHNHPSGLCEPSQADKRITIKLQKGLDLMDIRVLDHIIVAGMDTFSFAKELLL